MSQRGGRPRRDDLAFANQAAQLWGEACEDISFLARIFTQTALPYRDPGDVPEWQRRNGSLTLTVQPGASSVDPRTGQKTLTGYPYGSIPRLLLVWMSTEAVRTGERVLPLGESLSDFMRQLGLIVSGGQHGNIRRLREQAERLFRAHITIDVREVSGTWTRARSERLNVSEGYDLWHSETHPEQPALLPSYVELSEKFFREVTTRPVPLSFDALKALRGSPMRLDIYAWLAHRMSYVRKTTAVPWESLMLQFGSNATSDWGRRKFRKDFLAHLTQVLAVYPEARVTPTDSSLLLNPSRTHVAKRLPRGT